MAKRKTPRWLLLCGFLLACQSPGQTALAGHDAGDALSADSSPVADTVASTEADTVTEEDTVTDPDAPSETDAALAPKTRIRILHPNLTGIALRGDTAPLSWDSDRLPDAIEGKAAIFDLPVAAAATRVKAVRLGVQVQWAIGSNFIVQPAATVDLYPYFLPGSAAASRDDFTIDGPTGAGMKGGPRQVRVLLPPGYNENTLASYPLLLMHDGQNVFDDATATFGVAWKVQDAMISSMAAGKLTEIVIVAVDHGGAARIFEYTPWADSSFDPPGGGGETLLKWLDSAVLPELDKRYRLSSEQVDRVIGGSSLGGLLSCYALLTRPATWGGAMCMSGSWWWKDKTFEQWAPSKLPSKPPVRIWLDAGTVKDGLTEARSLRDKLLASGFKLGESIGFYEAQGANHSEGAWQARVHLPLRFFFDPGDREAPFK